MHIRCPACRKVNDSTDECKHCGGSLSVLRRIRTAAIGELNHGKEHLKRLNAGKALHSAEASWRMKKSVPDAKLAFLVSLMPGSFSEATRWYILATTGGLPEHVRDSQLGIMDTEL